LEISLNFPESEIGEAPVKLLNKVSHVDSMVQKLPDVAV
jgi:hypothetical protein